MDLLNQALRGAAARATAGDAPAASLLRPLQRVLVVGAGGALGSAVLAEALVASRFARVLAVVREPVASALRGFEPLPLQALDGRHGAEVALVVYERARHSNRRDDAFVQPDPTDLRALAATLHGCGVRRLVVVVPHAPALLPQALKAGLASLDEAAVAALGFEHLVFVRAAMALQGAAAGSLPDRFAAWWLSQLRWMVPASDEPLRSATLAQRVVLLAKALPGLPGGTRVLTPGQLQPPAA